MVELNQKINVKNIEEYKELLAKAKKQSVQLQRTIEQIQSFQFEIDLES